MLLQCSGKNKKKIESLHEIEKKKHFKRIAFIMKLTTKYKHISIKTNGTQYLIFALILWKDSNIQIYLLLCFICILVYKANHTCHRCIVFR